MAHTVYLLGAGINRNAVDESESPQGRPYSIRPPLATDFFKEWLRHPKMLDWGDHIRQEVSPQMYDYIERYWKLTYDDLEEQAFDLEECYTLIQQQKSQSQHGTEQHERLTLIEDQLTTSLRIFLAWFASSRYLYDSGLMQLAQLILLENAAVLTYNYDTLMEEAFETVSGLNKEFDSDNPIDFLHGWHRWKRLLAYGFDFDEIEVAEAPNEWVVGSDAVHARLGDRYDPPLLKLHGSLNWATYTRYREGSDGQLVTRYVRHEESVYGTNMPGQFNYRTPRSEEGFKLETLIVTPVLYKDFSRYPLSTLWSRAKQELVDCKRLVVGGYSFPPTDFQTRRLFLEVFADNTLDELIVINPSDHAVALAKQLTHAADSIVFRCRNLGGFIERYA